jgi:hypothetical protein
VPTKAAAEPRADGGGGSVTVVFTYGPLNRIINVHWTGGLAVEFFDRET